MAPTLHAIRAAPTSTPDLTQPNCTLSRPATIGVITALSILLLASLCANVYYIFFSASSSSSSRSQHPSPPQPRKLSLLSNPGSKLRAFSFSTSSFPSFKSSSSSTSNFADDDSPEKPDAASDTSRSRRPRLRVLRTARDARAEVRTRFLSRRELSVGGEEEGVVGEKGFYVERRGRRRGESRGVEEEGTAGEGGEGHEEAVVAATTTTMTTPPRMPVRAVTRGPGSVVRGVSFGPEERGLGTVVLRG